MADEIIGGRYRLTNEIGSKDGMRTYKALDESGQVAAIELMPARTADDLSRLDSWGETMLELQHPDLPRYFGYGPEGESFYVAREYVVGTNLKTLVAGGPLSPARATRYAMQICDALAVAHRLGIVHGDLRPHNLVLTRRDMVKVTEFQMPAAQAGVVQRTATAPDMWHYASPEEIRGVPLTPASDVYSLGVVLYELVTGRVPFDGATAEAVRGMHLMTMPKPPRDLNIHVSEELQRVILTALSKDPQARYQSVETMRDELARTITVGAVPAVATRAPATVPGAAPAVVPGAAVAVPAAVPAPMAAPRRRVWPWVLLAAALALLLAVAAAFIGAALVAPVGVPSLSGMSEAQAATALKAAGLQIGTIVTQPTATRYIGRVVTQNPSPGIRVRKGTKVGVAVGGLTIVTLPDLTGQNQATVAGVLQQLGLRVGKVTLAPTTRQPPGTVVGQTPGAGTQAPAGTTVALSVAKAPTVNQVPNVVGVLEADAVERLEVKGFKIIRSTDYSSTIRSGVVLSQSPDPGTPMAPGSAVTMVISVGPQVVEVPYVVGLSRPTAIETLHRVGLNVLVTFETTTTALNDKVLRQSIASGSGVPPSTRIEIIVGTE